MLNNFHKHYPNDNLCLSGGCAYNGLANGKNKGIAPDSKIVMVSSNVNAANWVLTVADACDYIFKIADSLGLPAVINNSNGIQFGSRKRRLRIRSENCGRNSK